MGPASGVAVCLIKNLINVLSTTTGGVGELANFLLGASFVLPAGLIYRKMKSRKGALIGSVVGALIMAVVCVPLNYYVTYPFYTLFMPMEGIIAAYRAILPIVDNLIECLIVFNMPFTFVKGLLNVLIAFLIYKPLSPILHGKHSAK